MSDSSKSSDKLVRQKSEYQLATTALLYYKDGLTQSEIAKRLGVSRATVINHLRLARDQGIVDIRVNGSSFSTNKLAKDLKNRFNLEDVYVASVFEDASLPEASAEDAGLRQVARVAAMALCEIVSPDDIFGVAWGKTVQYVAEELPAVIKPRLSVYQMIGSMKAPTLQATETCAINIARKFGAECFTLHAPAILTTTELANGLRAEPIIKNQLEQLGHMTTTLFSVGSRLPRTRLVQAGIASTNDLDWYVQNGAVGVTCGRFIDKDGNQVVGPLDERMIGVSLEQIKAAKTGVLVISGLHKVEAAMAAIRGGFVTHLVLDEKTGKALLEAS